MKPLPTALLGCGLFVVIGATGAAAQDTALPHLAGTVIGPTAREALIKLGREHQSVAPGDEIGTWIVQTITAGHVVLVGPGGTLDLSLASRPQQTESAAPERMLDWNNPCGRVHGSGSRRDTVLCRGARAAVASR